MRSGRFGGHHRFWEWWNVLLRSSVDCDFLRLDIRRSNLVVDWRAFDGDRRLLVSRQVGYWRLVETSSGVYVDSVDDLIGAFAAIWCGMRRLVLSGWSEQEAAIWGEGQTSEEGGEGFVRVDVGISNAQSNASSQAWRC